METTQTQTAYDQLIEERSAYQITNMTAKVQEWDYKIRVLEVSQKYDPITFVDMAEEFGLKGLNEAVQKRQVELEKEVQGYVQHKRELKEKATKMCGDLLKSRVISESKLYAFIDAHSWQYQNDPEMTQAIIELVVPKLSPTIAQMFKTMFTIKKIENQKESNWQEKKVAFIKVEKVEDYKQNDNPPFEELCKLVEAKVSNLFHTLYIAYPMIDTEKQIDPIFFGTLRNPNVKYDELNGMNNGWFFNHSITEDRLEAINIGDMFRIAQWI